MFSTNYDTDSDEEDEGQVFFKTSFVVIAIDVHPIMFQERKDGSMPFRDCIETCYNLADSLIFSSSRRKCSQFAIILAREDLPILTEFDANILDSVKLLKGKTAMSNQQLKDEYQRKGDFDLASFFLICKKAFHDIKSAFYKRTLIYITDDENPVQNAQQKFTALNEAKTFGGNQINFQIIPTRIDFNYNIFYNELFSLMDTTPVEEICEDKDGLMEKLLSSVVMRHSQTKMLFYPFKDDYTRFINCFKEDVIHSSTLLNIRLTKDGKPIKRVAENDNPSFSFKNNVTGCDTIKFDLYEKTTLLDNGFPLGLTLLYVSKRLTDVGYVLGKPFLLRQNEKFESPLFKKFWQNCVDNERVLVCARKLKHPGRLRYVELIPEVVNGFPMFLVKNVPYSSEIVYPKENDYPEQEEDLKKKEAMKKLVDDLTFDFDIKMIPDPCYRKKRAYVKAKLLDEPMEEVTDISFNLKAMDEHLQEAVNIIKYNYVLTDEKKRKASSSTSRAKKIK